MSRAGARRCGRARGDAAVGAGEKVLRSALSDWPFMAYEENDGQSRGCAWLLSPAGDGMGKRGHPGVGQDAVSHSASSVNKSPCIGMCSIFAISRGVSAT